jgi:FAS-associated factor 2
LLRSTFTIFQRILTFITTFFPYLTRFGILSGPSRRQLAPQDTASRFIREFEERDGSEHVKFEEHGYAAMTHSVKENLGFLVIVLLSEEHDDTAGFCKDVLCDDQLREWLPRNDCSVWGGNVADAEAHTGTTFIERILTLVSNSLNCTRYPFVALIANIPSPTPSSPPQMTLLTRIEGPVTTAQLITTLTTAVNRTRPLLNRRKALKQEQDSARALRRMQEEAYSTSLARDREREEQERIRAVETARLEQERLAKSREVERLQHNKEQWRLWKAAELKKFGLVGMQSEIGKTARVGLRLAEGKRIVQMFPGDFSLLDVYSFVECYDLLFPPVATGVTLRTASDSTVIGDFEKPEDYEHEFMFRLVAPLPRKVIDSGTTRVRDEAALWPSGSIVVEPIDEDSDSEEDSEGEE